MNVLIKGINIALKPLYWVAEMFGGNVEIPLIPKVTLPRFADGGWAGAGQLINVRERGAEIVGFNSGSGRAEVMNNTQIAEIVGQAVYNAVVDASKTQSSISNNFREVSQTGLYEYVAGYGKRIGNPAFQ